MRSGLQKPGTVPFLALVIFCLLTLVPTLAKEWGFYSAHLAYLGLPRYDGRYSSSRVKNASIDTHTRSRILVSSNNCKSWLFGDFYSSCIDRNAQPHHSAINVPPRSSFEFGAELGNDPITYSATKEPSSITRGVTAFKEFMFQRWDDQQMTQPLPPWQESVEEISTASTHPTRTLTNLSISPASSSGQQRQPTPANELDVSSPAEYSTEGSLLFRLPLFIHETWQQVCHAGGHYFESLTTRYPSPNYNQPLIPNNPAPAPSKDEQEYLEHLHPEEQAQPERTSGEELLLNNGSSSQPDISRGLKDSQPTPTLMTAGQSKYIGFRRDSEHMRGSSMAIVIGLVAGIMWF
ncbi:uncharacterized protein APUU_50602S [Aspergillus puulaauensis]|uniref:Uncharacterized protein n=1 Tax=Aspergillus puulaauensis TaxID=1220207 RepID=A0A7R7XQJ7_9EURO|nr:uncharacterized protein APUU_50602S [Aspergillus puulaauensis]BCS25891.1 hypothetical protein APUU_50602S [Aspergillus puulaauensis]